MVHEIFGAGMEDIKDGSRLYRDDSGNFPFAFQSFIVLL